MNFATTRSGLAAQLLGVALQLDRPELELRSGQLTADAEQMRVELDRVEQLLLDELAQSEGSLLDNTQLLDSLNRSVSNFLCLVFSVSLFCGFLLLGVGSRGFLHSSSLSLCAI